MLCFQPKEDLRNRDGRTFFEYDLSGSPILGVRSLIWVAFAPINVAEVFCLAPVEP